MTGWSQSMAIEALLGGAMIGVASAMMLLGLGRIAGISGLAARALGIASRGTPRPLATAFVVGLPIGAALIAGLRPVATTFPSAIVMVIGGLLVGFGARLGSGCTSGHGVCGLSRLSLRSIVATLMFMGIGFATVAVLRIVGVA